MCGTGVDVCMCCGASTITTHSRLPMDYSCASGAQGCLHSQMRSPSYLTQAGTCRADRPDENQTEPKHNERLVLISFAVLSMPRSSLLLCGSAQACFPKMMVYNTCTEEKGAPTQSRAGRFPWVALLREAQLVHNNDRC